MIWATEVSHNGTRNAIPINERGFIETRPLFLGRGIDSAGNDFRWASNGGVPDFVEGEIRFWAGMEDTAETGGDDEPVEGLDELVEGEWEYME